ncbi:acyltransferase [Paraburkholderia guartelaensis]|uniref:Acyltransferase n=1 Tax=Paraburkholderia guartelaensis TaxID=2546446 RepID=A0A4R5L2H8_9BURK|nr:acyltransferase [Paraburkholderia guartelaensis]TDG01945.1 acyltransferase [Paraburkholderia guartelaensis]
MVSSIQFLRFVASFLVLVSHSANVLNVPKSITVGDAGVDIFFIVSGFVIGLVGPLEPSATQFWLKRLIRVFPLYWIALLAFIGFRYYMWHVVPGTVDFLHSFALIPSLEPGWSPILFPAWTLSYEMFFYAVFGIALALSRRYAVLSVSLLFLLLGCTPLRSIGGALDLTLLLEFIAGLMVVIGYQRLWISKRNPALGKLMIAAAVVMLFVHSGDVKTRVIEWGVPSLILVLGMIQLEGMQFFRKGIVPILGAASYATYLFHITLMTAVREAVASQFHTDLRGYPLVGMPLLVAVSLVGGVLVHLYVEKPIMVLLRRLLRRPQKQTNRATAPSRAIQSDSVP